MSAHYGIQYGASTNTTNTLYRMLYEIKQEQATVLSTNSINPPAMEDMCVIYTDAQLLANALSSTAPPNKSALFSKHMIWALKYGQYNFNKYNKNGINFQIPVSLFYSDEMLHFGSDGACQIVMNVNPNWAQNLIQITGSSSCTIANGQAYGIKTLSSGPTKCTINCNITDIKLYLCRAHVTNIFVPRSVTQTITLKQFHPFITQLSNTGSSNTISVPMVADRRISHIIIGFMVAPLTKFKSSPTDLQCLL